MPYTTIINAAELAMHLNDLDWAIVDSRFALADTEQGRRDYLEDHISGAVYAHMDNDLSGPIVPGKTGRHPLPNIEQMAARLSNWGIDAQTQVVVYDNVGGAFAARLWWLLHWLGHESVAVLDGGWRGWQAAGGTTTAGEEVREARTFAPDPRDDMVLDVTAVQSRLRGRSFKLFDSRGADRYRGENETIDPVAGHIPGSHSAPFAENLNAQGHFRSVEELQTRFEQLLQDSTPDEATFYCGSGVTAAHNLLAMAHAGMEGAQLFAGSWSEWITDPARPVATGEGAGI